MPSNSTRRFSFCLAAVVLPLKFSMARGADNSFGPDFTVTSYNANITVHKNSAVTVEETFEVELREVIGTLWRDIPADFVGKQGEQIGVYVSVKESYVDSHQVEQPVVDRLGGMVRVQLPIDTDAWGKYRFQLKYKIENAIEFLSEGDQFVWDIVGKSWRAEILKATATIQFDSNLVPQDFEIDCNTGSLGYRTGDCLAEISGGEIVYSSTRALRAFEGLTLAVYLPKGVLTPPTAWQQLVWHYNLRSNWLFALPLASFLIMVWRWARKRRLLLKPRNVRSINEVPSFDELRLSPADVGVLFTERFSEIHIAATFLDLANRGFLQLREKNEARFRDFVIIPKTGNGGSPTDFEWKLVGLTQKSNSGQEPLISNCGDALSSGIASLRSNIESSLVMRGYLRARPTVFGRQILIAAAVVTVATVILGLQFTELHIALIIPLAIFTAIPLAAIAFFDTVKTERGVQAYRSILGWEHYLSDTTTGGKSSAVSLEEFERLLPYAIVLDLLGDWASKNRDLKFECPGWYISEKHSDTSELTPQFFQGVARSILFRLQRIRPEDIARAYQGYEDEFTMPKAPTNFGSKVLFRSRERR